MPMLKVNPGEKFPRPYWPKELIGKGYAGDIEAVPNACVLIIPKPGARARDVARSLRIMADDFEHRADISGEKKEDPPSPELEIPSKELLKINGKKYRVYLNLGTKRFRAEPVDK